MRWLIIILIFTSCNPLRHYTKVVNDPFRNEKERELLARASLQEFPPVSGEPTITVTVDSAGFDELNKEYNKLVEDYAKHIAADTLRGGEIDTVFLTKIRALKPAVITRTITKQVEVRNTAVENQLQSKINACSRENEQLVSEAKGAKDSQKKTRSTNIWLYVVSGILLLGHIVRTKKLFA